jgi:hypothetical protein
MTQENYGNILPQLVQEVESSSFLPARARILRYDNVVELRPKFLDAFLRRRHQLGGGREMHSPDFKQTAFNLSRKPMNK